MQEKLLNILEKLNIEIVYVDRDSYCENEQIVYSTKEKDSNFSDDKNKSIVYEVNIIYRYRNLSNVTKYTKIKEYLKSKKLIFKNANDILNGEIYEKEMLFEYEETS